MVRRQSLLELLQRADLEPTNGERNIMVKCPFAPYTGLHRSLRDGKPSMGIKYSEHEPFLVNCFTCGYRSRSLHSMFHDLAHKSTEGRYLLLMDEARSMEELDEDGILAVLDQGTELRLRARDQPVYEYTFPKAYNHWYLSTRGITEHTAKVWDCTYDDEKQRIVIPILCRENKVRGATGRAISDNTRPKYHNYWDMKKGYWLLGEQLIKGSGVIVVEGPFDALMTYQHLSELNLLGEYSVVSLLGAKFTQRQCDRLVANASEVIVFLDRDEAGRVATEQMMNVLADRMLVSRVDYGLSNYKDPGSMPSEEFLRILESASLFV